MEQVLQASHRLGSPPGGALGDAPVRILFVDWFENPRVRLATGRSSSDCGPRDHPGPAPGMAHAHTGRLCRLRHEAVDGQPSALFRAISIRMASSIRARPSGGKSDVEGKIAPDDL